MPARIAGQVSDAWLSFVTGRSGRIASLFAILMATLLFGYHLKGFQIANSIQGWVEQDEPELMNYRRFLEFFRGFEMIALAVESKDGVFTPEALKRIDSLTRKITERGDHVKAIYSVSNLNSMRKIGPIIGFAPLMEKVPETKAEADAFRDELMKNRIVRKNLVSKDMKSSLIAIFIGGGGRDYSYISRNLDQIESVMREEAAPGMKYHLAGALVLNREMNRETKRQAMLFGPIVFGLIALLLAILLKSIRDLLIVQLSAGISLVWAVGYYVWTGHAINFLTVAMPPLVLVISVASAVHIISRYYEERDRGLAPREAARSSIAVTIEPCLFTSITTAAGFGVLSANRIPALRDFGIYTAIGVMLAFVATIFFVPSALAAFDGRGDRSARKTARKAGWNMYHAIHEISRKHKRWAAAVSVLLAVASIPGILKIKVDTNNKEFFKADSMVRRDMEFVESSHAGMASMEFMFSSYPDSMLSPKRVREMLDLQRFLEKQPEITGTLSIGDYLVEMKRMMTGREGELPSDKSLAWELLSGARFGSKSEARAYVRDRGVQTRVSARVKYPSTEQMRQLKAKIEKYLADRPEGGSNVVFTGGALVYLAIADCIIEGQRNSSILVLVIIAAMMMVLFRSLSWGLIAMIPNIIPIMMVMAMMGWCKIPLNIATMMIASISLGLVVDDTMHFMTRCRREMIRGAANEEAAKIAIETTGRAMVISSVVLSIGFGILVFSNFLPIMQFGLLTATTMMIALIADLLLTPALVMLFRLRPYSRSSKPPRNY